MEAEPEVLAASVESTSEKKVWPELALREERASLATGPQHPLGPFPFLSAPVTCTLVPPEALLPTAELPTTTPAVVIASLPVHFLPTQPLKPKSSLTTLPRGGDN